MEWLTTREAADMLAVTPRRVQAMVGQGILAAERVGRILLIDPTSVHRARATTRRAGRPLSPSGAWAVLLTNLGTHDWATVTDRLGISAQRRFNLRQLIERTPVTLWPALVGGRAHTHRYDVRATYLTELLALEGVVPSGVSAVGIHDVIAINEGEAYLDDDLRRSLESEYRLRTATKGNLVLHVPSVEAGAQSLILNRPNMPPAVVAVDLIDSGEPRSQRAGLETLRRLRGAES